MKTNESLPKQTKTKQNKRENKQAMNVIYLRKLLQLSSATVIAEMIIYNNEIRNGF